MSGASTAAALGSCCEGLLGTVLCLVVCLFIYLSVFYYIMPQYFSSLWLSQH